MNLKTLLLPVLFAFSSIHSQEVFFKSPQAFTDDELYDFYCSFRIEGNTLLFNAPDYSLYAFDKTSGNQLWSRPLRFKTNHPPRVVNNAVWANANGVVAMIDIKTGDKIRDLPLGSIESEPLLKDGIVYATGIVDGGMVFAYNPVADTVVWSRFIAHGCSRQPYYLDDRIIANAEGDHWIELNYSGQLTTPGCEGEEDQFPSELPCVRNFVALTHDRKEINDMMGESFFSGSYRVPAIQSIGEKTFAFFEGVLTVFGNNLEKRESMQFDKLVDNVEWNDQSLQRIVLLDEQRAWILYSNRIFIVDHVKKKITRVVDLSTWDPHQVQVDGEKLWLISRNDGRLYGLKL